MWRVRVRSKRINKRFEDEEKARVYYKECKKKYKKVLIATTKMKPIEGKGKRGELWCPSCGEWRKFKKASRRNVKICDWCGLSDNDFYVKKYNNLWGMD